MAVFIEEPGTRAAEPAEREARGEQEGEEGGERPAQPRRERGADSGAEERRGRDHVARGRGETAPPEDELRAGEIDGEQQQAYVDAEGAARAEENDQPRGRQEVDGRPGEEAVPAVEEDAEDAVEKAAAREAPLA